MIEILNIFFVIVFFLLLSFFPINIYSFQKSSLINKNIYDVLTVNLLISFVGLLFISFFSLNYIIYFILLFLSSAVFNLFYFTKNKNFLKKYLNINFLYFLICNLIIFIHLAGNPTMTWDGIENWYFKAQNFFYNFNFFDLNNTRGTNYYPHFGSFLWGFFWKNSVLQYEYIGRLFYVFIFLLSIFSICDLIKKNNYIKPVVISLILILCYDRFLFGGYQDILLFSFLIFLSKYFYFYNLTKKNFYLIISFLFLNFLPWLKNEGYLFVIVFLIALLFYLKNTNKKKEIIFFILFSFIFLIIKNLIFLKYLNINPTHGANLDFSFNAEDFLTFISIMSKGLIVAIFKYKIWIFIIFSVYYVKKNKNIFKSQNIFINFMLINLILYLLMVFGIYFDYLDEPRGLYWWIHTTLDRLIYSISGFFIIFFVLILNHKQSKL